MLGLLLIKSFRHKGLEKFFETGNAAVIQTHHATGFKLHPLKADLQGRWSISVSANWRLTFAFQDGNAEVLDYEDYH